MAGTSALRKGALSLLFGLMAAQGLMSSSAAQAQTAGQDAATAPADSESAQTQASRNLERMRAYYAARMAGNTALGAVDSDRLYANALPGTADADLMRSAIISDGAVADDASLATMLEAADSLNGPYTPTEGINLAHQILSPRAVPNLHTASGSAMCIVITAQADMQLFVPNGLTIEQTARYANRHEFHHCMSRSLRALDSAQDDVHASNAHGAINPAVFDFAASGLAEETRADLGALMDMIVIDGENPSIINNIAAWREQRMASAQQDINHYSSPVLRALAQRVEQMGVARFRRMDEGARSRLAEDLIRQNSLSAGALVLVAAHMYHIDDLRQFNVRITPRDHALASPALTFMRANPDLVHGDFTPVKLAADQVAQLNTWNIEEQLRASATNKDGQMTRLGVLSARSAVLDDLRRQLVAEPSNPMHGARIILTQRATQHLLQAVAEHKPAAAENKNTAAAKPNKAAHQ